jgi:hypothetical protein
MLRPKAAAAILTAIQVLNVAVIYAIASRMFGGEATRVRRMLAGIAAALGALSAMFVSLLGTSFVDVLVSIPVLVALLLLLPPVSARQPRVARLALAGLVMGIAVGLKLTNLFLVVGFVCATLVGWPSWRDRIRAAIGVGLGGVVGAVAMALPWAIRMYREFGHPLFPMYGSGETIARWRDVRFQPDGVVAALAYPWRWATGVAVSSEIPFTDVRPILLVAAAACAVAAWRVPRPVSAGEADARARVVTFLFVGTAVWLAVSGLHRFALPLDLLVGPALVLCCRRLLPVRGAIVASVCLVVVALVTMRPADWGRREWTRTWFDVALPKVLETPATYVLLGRSGAPLGWVVPSFPSGSVFVHGAYAKFVAPESVLARRARAIFDAAPADRTFALIDAPPDVSAAAAMRALGFDVAMPCRRVRSTFRPIAACPLRRAARSLTDMTPRLEPERWASPGWPGDGSLLLGAGWSAPQRWGRWAVGPRAMLRFRTAPPHAWIFEVVGHAPADAPARAIEVWSDGRHVADWTFAREGDVAGRPQVACLVARDDDEPTVVELRTAAATGPSVAVRRMRLRAPQPGECSR